MKMLQVLFFLALVGCATITPAEKYQKEIKEHGDSVWGKDGSTVPMSTFWETSANIAQKHDRPRERELFLMMKLEALKKESNGLGQYDYLERKFLSGDASIFNDAESYFITINSQNQCASFGYQVGTGDFNKCVFDVRLKLLDRKIQMDQFTLQMLMANRPRPISLPSQTSCTTSGNQTNCITR